MLHITDTALNFAFPEVDPDALLQVYFVPMAAPDRRLSIRGSVQDGVRFTSECQFLVYMNPTLTGQLRQTDLRWPFALLASVRGRNVITGSISQSLERTPQNYFSTPPQGAIDGYFEHGDVCPFRASSDPDHDRTRFDLRVFPMKSQAFNHYKRQLQLIPGPGAMISGLAITHGGNRNCEPIYEDLCCFGDWNREFEQHVIVWIE